MRAIAETNMLLRVQAELPPHMRVATLDFGEGWNFLRAADSPLLKKRIQSRGWNFIKIDEGALRSGVGETSQQAIASALKLALRRVAEHFNAAEVKHIELTHYPWFVLARVRVNPYRIQQGDSLLARTTEPLPAIVSRRREKPAQLPALFPHFASDIPMLKQMLISSRVSEARPL